MNVEACLPPALQSPTTTITPIAAGLSGAGVYRVEAAGGVYVLKVSAEDEPVGDWRRRVSIQRAAAAAGATPAIVHVDDVRRAVLTAFVVDRSFAAFVGDPRTRAVAVAELGRTIRRIHDLPLPPDATAREPRTLLATICARLQAEFTVPAFAADAAARVLAETPPADARADVLGHNDLNPTNLIFDGERILVVDWQTAGPMHPFYDLAAISVFLRLDEPTCRALLAAHDDAPVDELPARFGYLRRLTAALCGTMFIWLAHRQGHPGATAADTRDGSPTLADFYQRLRGGQVDIATATGQWAFGLALLKESLAL